MSVKNGTTQRIVFDGIITESPWIVYNDGDGYLYLNICPKNPDNTSAEITGEIVIEQAMTTETPKEWEICSVVKNDQDLNEDFVIDNTHIGKAGIQVSLPKTCSIRFKVKSGTARCTILVGMSNN